MHPRAARLIEELQLEPHPEGGFYRRIHTSAQTVMSAAGLRPESTEIRYLLVAGEVSAWHRIDADERWHWQEGGALRVSMFDARRRSLQHAVLGPAVDGNVEEIIVPAGVWQSAKPVGDYTLVACRVTPGFVWEGFELLDEASDLAAELARLETIHSSGEGSGGWR